MKIYKLLMIFTLSLLLAAPVANAAITLKWTQAFTSTYPSGDAVFEGVYKGDTAANGGTCQIVGRGKPAMFDYSTGNVFTAYTAGDGNSESSDGVLAKLRASDGQTLGASTTSGTTAVAACGVGLDQRGRVYTMLGPCYGTSLVNSYVARTSDLSLLREFSEEDVCSAAVTSSGRALGGPLVDVFGEMDTNHSRILWASHAPGATNAWRVSWESVETPTIYNKICQGGVDATTTENWRDDGTFQDKMWSNGAGTLYGFRPETCTQLGGGTGSDLGNACTTSNAPNATINCFYRAAGDSLNLYVNKFDPFDNSGAMTINSTATITQPNFPDPLDDGIQAFMGVGSPHRAFTDIDGNEAICGVVQSQSGGDQYAYFAAYNSTYAQVYNVTVQISGGGAVAFGFIDCDFGQDGAILFAFASNTISANHAYLRVYCCADVGRRLSTAGFLLISAAGSGGGGNGGTGTNNPVLAARGFCSDAWGFDCAWLFLMMFVGIAVVGFGRVSAKPLVVGIGILLAVGLWVAIFDEYIWVLFVIVFGIIALAGKNLFGSGGDEE